MKTKTYQKLPGTRKKRYTLWAGDDHLLLVRTRTMETYRRFYYNDICQVTLQTTPYGMIESLTYGLIFLSSIVSVIIISLPLVKDVPSQRILRVLLEENLVIIFGINAIVMGAALLLICIRGTTCVSRIQTRVQNTEIPCLNRKKTALRCFGKFIPIIESTQGKFSKEDIQREIAKPVFQQRAYTLPNLPGISHAISFALILLCGILDALDYFIRAGALTSFLNNLFFISFVAILVSIFRHRGKRNIPVLRELGLAGAGYILIASVFGYLFFLSVSLSLKGKGFYSVWNSHSFYSIEVLRFFSTIKAGEHPVLTAYYVFAAIIGTGIGITGLYQYGRCRFLALGAAKGTKGENR